MKALVLVQSTRLETYVNVFAAICNKYKAVKQIRLLYVTDDLDSVTKKTIRERLVELSKEHPIYENAADVMKDDDKCSAENLKSYLLGWDIIDVSGTSKEISLTAAAISVSSKSVHVCLVNWPRNFKRNEEWILTEDNHEYINLLSSGDLALLRKDHFQKKHVIIAFAGIFGLLTAAVVLKMLFPSFFIPNVVVNIFGLLIGAAGLYLAAVSLKNG
ncbi:MAG: hypothetical protein D3910_03760 [Candidatus Electrothrix sp. ATG2]|nr:hypothetical protein [Candidatus Electrothrix sp. ATG2]